MIKIKVCGLTEEQHVLAAGEASVDFIGLVFASSLRQISPEKALRLSEAAHGHKSRLEVVGVFVNSPIQEVNRIARSCQLDWVQLSGDETWQYCLGIECPIIKAIHISPLMTAEEILSDINLWHEVPLQQQPICLLDTRTDNAYGGTGQTFNWQISKEVSCKFPVIIAGGLSPANIDPLIRFVQPWGVDVSTGVESNGKKDSLKINAFVKAVRKAEANLFLI